MNLNEQLLQLESDFAEFRNGFQNRYLMILALYFSPPVILIFVLSFFFKDWFNNIFVKIGLAVLILAALILHYYLRNTWYKTNRRYQDFLKEKLESLKTGYSDEESFRKAVVEAARSWFQSIQRPFDHAQIKNHIYWYNIFIALGIEINPDD